METICITRKICIDGNKLDKNIKAHLLQKIIELTSNECSKEYGHILKIENLEEIVTNTISNANSNIVFTVKFKAVVFKPVEGEKISGKVCMIFETGGIFIEILEKQQLLIPISYLSGYTYNKDTETFTCKKKSIKKGDILTCVIKGVQNNNNNFSCFGAVI